MKELNNFRFAWKTIENKGNGSEVWYDKVLTPAVRESHSGNRWIRPMLGDGQGQVWLFIEYASVRQN